MTLQIWTDNNRKLLIRHIYEMVPSQMENKKKRIVVKDIQNKENDRLVGTTKSRISIYSGITVSVHAISNPHYPLTESVQKNLLKLYLNDVGMLTHNYITTTSDRWWRMSAVSILEVCMKV